LRARESVSEPMGSGTIIVFGTLWEFSTANDHPADDQPNSPPMAVLLEVSLEKKNSFISYSLILLSSLNM